MSVMVFSFHAKLSWLPDNPRGYVARGKGVLPQDTKAGARYRRNASQSPFLLDADDQRAVVEELLAACDHQTLRPHFIATEPTHVHALVSWSSDKAWTSVRNGLKLSITKLLRWRHEEPRREFLSDGSSRKQIRNQDHFNRWLAEYGPKHSGWKWREGVGMFRD